MAFLANIIKIVTMFIKAIFEDSKKFTRNRNYVPKCNLYLYFLIDQNWLISGDKILISAKLKRCDTWFMYILNIHFVGYNFAKVHHCRLYVTDFRGGGGLFAFPLCEQSQKCPCWIGLRIILSKAGNFDWKWLKITKHICLISRSKDCFQTPVW